MEVIRGDSVVPQESSLTRSSPETKSAQRSWTGRGAACCRYSITIPPRVNVAALFPRQRGSAHGPGRAKGNKRVPPVGGGGGTMPDQRSRKEGLLINPPSPLSLGAVERIDEACLRFEEAWQRGPEPLLSEYLSLVPESERDALLRELPRLDLHYRRK